MKPFSSNFRLAQVAVVALIISTPVHSFAQGSLTPSGAPAPMMKTLTQVEPRVPISSLPVTLTNSGSYYLTTNLFGVSGSNGITIAANDITLDLNGFALVGVPGALTGIASPTQRYGVTIRNGVLRNWPQSAVNVSAIHAMCEGLNVYSNSGSFAVILGAFINMDNCVVSLNSAGVSVGEGSIVRNTIIRQNGGHGLFASNSSSVLNSSIYANGGDGINSTESVSVEGCTIRTNALNGLYALTGARISRCNISLNRSNGVSIASGGRVTDCVINSNRVDGIRVTARCTIANNSIDYNGTSGNDAGIHLLSTDNRVEDNNLTSNLVGIYSDQGFNLIVRNKATLNSTDYSFHPADISGGISLTATNAGPWANFRY